MRMYVCVVCICDARSSQDRVTSWGKKRDGNIRTDLEIQSNAALISVHRQEVGALST